MSSDADPPHPDPGPPDLNGMVAVAAGRAGTVAGWATFLWRASIRSVVVHPHTCSGADGPARDYVELWVAEADSEQANTVLRQSDPQYTRPGG